MIYDNLHGSLQDFLGLSLLLSDLGLTVHSSGCSQDSRPQDWSHLGAILKGFSLTKYFSLETEAKPIVPFLPTTCFKNSAAPC